MDALHLDFETFSAVDLRKAGTYRYAMDRSTRALLLSFGFNNEPVECVDLYHREPLPRRLLEMLLDPAVQKWAHNASFERAIFQYVLGIDCPPEQWRCTAVWARALALPAHLDALAKVVGAENQKIDGKRMVQLLCTPKNGGPAKHQDLWPDFIAYNMRDVDAERDVHRRLLPYPVPIHEWRLWALDQRINDRGIPIDYPFVLCAADAARINAAEVTAEVIERTDITNPGSRAQWLSWLAERDITPPDMRRGTIDKLREDETLPEDTRSILDLRRELASASVAKFDAVIRSVNEDDRVRGSFMFYGAGRTGRWSGKLVQPHNMPRGVLKQKVIPQARALVHACDLESIRLIWPEVSPVLASLVRTMIAAPPGRKLVAADLASIETVMLAWAAGCERLLNVFRDGKDSYIDFATVLFHTEYDLVSGEQRRQAKPAVLGCGYGMGGRGLAAYAASFGVVLTVDEAWVHVRAYRSRFPEIVQFWQEIEEAAFRAVMERSIERVGPFTFQKRGPFLFIDLPSGRSLAYYRPQIVEGRFGPVMQYDSGSEYGSTVRLSTYGAKLVENIVQAISRDVLAAGLMRADAAGKQIVMHVHDEIVEEADAEDTMALPTLIECMTRRIAWCHDAPLRAAGWEGALYRKD